MSGLLVLDCVVDGSPSSSVYCEGGKISSVSKGSELSAPAGATVVDGAGGTLLPGLMDTHCHPFDYGRLKRSVDLRGVSNVTGLRLRLQAGVGRSQPGEWVVGRGWNQEDFPGRMMPCRSDIDDVSPGNPVALSRVCGHVALLNSRAVEALGFGSRNGEEFERGPDGLLTGIVKEGAMTEALASVPRSIQTCAADLQAAEGEAARFGLTALHCIVSPSGFREELAAMQQLADGGARSLRYRVYVPPAALDFVAAETARGRFVGEKLRVNGVKIFADGSLGARTAALREPYSDAPASSGMLRLTDEALAEAVGRADAMGLQAIVHAIGDRAVEQAIGALAPVTGGGNERRHRIEHGGVLPKDLRRQMVKHGIRLAAQPLFVTSDTWAIDRLGEERIRDYYPLKSIMDEGIPLSGASDSPVESLSPLLGMWASMTRGGMVPEESLGLGQALSLYTSNAASNGFDVAGISAGAPADLTLLDSDISGMHPALLRKVGVAATVVAGIPVHSFGPG